MQEKKILKIRYNGESSINLKTLGASLSSINDVFELIFESGENPKIIQALLGHKAVSTTLTVYNSVDKTYFKQATSRLNDLFNQEHANAHKGGDKPVQAEKREEGQVKTIEYDEELQIEMLEKLLKEKRLKMQKQKEEAEM